MSTAASPSHATPRPMISFNRSMPLARRSSAFKLFSVAPVDPAEVCREENQHAKADPIPGEWTEVVRRHVADEPADHHESRNEGDHQADAERRRVGGRQ